jgi:predicted O-methyltransferase YrrM
MSLLTLGSSPRTYAKRVARSFRGAMRRVHRHVRTPSELERLARSPDPAARRMAAAIKAVVHDDLDSDEREWAVRIEALRARLLASTENVTIVDYGAGDPGLGLREEALGGRQELRRVADICRDAATPPAWGRLLLKIVREFQPERCLELGTSLGVTAMYQSAALDLNGSGQLVSLEGAQGLVEIAQRNLAELALERTSIIAGRFQATLGGVLISHAPLDYAFIDGHHDGDATIAYFERLLPIASDGAVVVFDDIAWSSEMRDAWRTIAAHLSVRLAIDLFKMGICVLGPARADTGIFRIAID